MGRQGYGAYGVCDLWSGSVWLLALLMGRLGYGAYGMSVISGLGGFGRLHCWWVIGAMVPMVSGMGVSGFLRC